MFADVCMHRQPRNPHLTKVNKHSPHGYSKLTQCTFDSNKNKHDYYGSKYCVKKVL